MGYPEISLRSHFRDQESNRLEKHKSRANCRRLKADVRFGMTLGSWCSYATTRASRPTKVRAQAPKVEPWNANAATRFRRSSEPKLRFHLVHRHHVGCTFSCIIACRTDRFARIRAQTVTPSC